MGLRVKLHWHLILCLAQTVRKKRFLFRWKRKMVPVVSLDGFFDRLVSSKTWIVLAVQTGKAAAAPLLHQGRTARQIGHDFDACCGRKPRPAGDFINGAQTTNTKPRFGVDDTKFNARTVHFVPFPYGIVLHLGLSDHAQTCAHIKAYTAQQRIRPPECDG
jgi:hypothetical protein